MVDYSGGTFSAPSSTSGILLYVLTMSGVVIPAPSDSFQNGPTVFTPGVRADTLTIGSPPPITRYRMLGKRTISSVLVTWVVPNNPDLTGEFSPLPVDPTTIRKTDVWTK